MAKLLHYSAVSVEHLGQVLEGETTRPFERCYTLIVESVWGGV
jgi:hypothetical protein